MLQLIRMAKRTKKTLKFWKNRSKMAALNERHAPRPTRLFGTLIVWTVSLSMISFPCCWLLCAFFIAFILDHMHLFAWVHLISRRKPAKMVHQHQSTITLRRYVAFERLCTFSGVHLYWSRIWCYSWHYRSTYNFIIISCMFRYVIECDARRDEENVQWWL